MLSCLSLGYEPGTANPPALRLQLHTPLLSAFVAATFYCNRRSNSASDASTSIFAAQLLTEPKRGYTHTRTHTISNNFKISLLKGKDNYAI
jgi:hypothetical protein